MNRLLLFFFTLLFNVLSFANSNKSIADTFSVTNHDIVKLYSEKHITNSGNEKDKFFAEVKAKSVKAKTNPKAHISKRDYTYLNDANKANITVELLYILKNGKGRIVCGSRTESASTPKSQGFVSAQPIDNDLCVKKILKVKDGDTFDYLACSGKTMSVRLSGIDAPEKGNNAYCGQPMSQKSKEKLSELLSKGNVKLVRTGVSHNRIVCEVYAGDVNVCLEMVKSGLAWREPHFDSKNKYVEAETKAKEQKIGIWSTKEKPLAPWKWRRLSKIEKQLLCR